MATSGLPSPPPKVASEDIVRHKADICLSNTVVKTGIGFSAGVVLSVLLFKRRSFPVWLGTGFGLGHGYTDCERSFNPASMPGVRIVPNDAARPSPPSSASASAGGEARRAAAELGEQLADGAGKVAQKSKEVVDAAKKRLI